MAISLVDSTRPEKFQFTAEWVSLKNVGKTRQPRVHEIAAEHFTEFPAVGAKLFFCNTRGIFARVF